MEIIKLTKQILKKEMENNIFGRDLIKDNIKIISINKRPWYKRFLSVNKYKVVVKQGKNRITMNCWAGFPDENLGSLFWNIIYNLEDYNKPVGYSYNEE